MHRDTHKDWPFPPRLNTRLGKNIFYAGIAVWLMGGAVVPMIVVPRLAPELAAFAEAVGEVIFVGGVALMSYGILWELIGYQDLHSRAIRALRVAVLCRMK